MNLNYILIIVSLIGVIGYVYNTIYKGIDKNITYYIIFNVVLVFSIIREWKRIENEKTKISE